MGDHTAAAPAGGVRPGATSQLAASEIMIVDDEPITARGYARALTSAGYHVTVASAGREGATLARGKRFDAIVSDISMPDMDGLALMREVRRREATAGGNTPAIALTAFTRDQDVQRALGAGYQLHLSKPVDIGPLARAILRLARPAPA